MCTWRLNSWHWRGHGSCSVSRLMGVTSPAIPCPTSNRCVFVLGSSLHLIMSSLLMCMVSDVVLRILHPFLTLTCFCAPSRVNDLCTNFFALFADSGRHSQETKNTCKGWKLRMKLIGALVTGRLCNFFTIGSNWESGAFDLMWLSFAGLPHYACHYLVTLSLVKHTIGSRRVN